MTLKASADIAALSLDDLAHAFALSQVGDRACKLQYPVIAACRELQLVHRRLHEIFAGFIQVAELADFGRSGGGGLPGRAAGHRAGRGTEFSPAPRARRGDAAQH